MTDLLDPGPFSQLVTPLILTFNEKENIARTLDSLAWARSIVVVDSGSTDGTLDILAAYPRVRVVHRAFDSFAEQCNFGLDQIETEWVLSLDADYVLSEALQREIARLDPPSAVAGFMADFVYCVFGTPLRSTLYPARTVLYRRSLARYRNDGHGHRVLVEGRVDALAGKIAHDDRKPIGRWFQSQIRYAQAEAEHLLSVAPTTLKRIDRLRKRGWPAPFIMLGYTLFWRGYVWDGRAGLYYCFQRVLAELMLAIEINDRSLRGALGTDSHQKGIASR